MRVEWDVLFWLQQHLGHHWTSILDGNKDVDEVRDKCEKLTIKCEVTAIC